MDSFAPRETAHVEAIARSGRVALTVSEIAACLRGQRPLPKSPVAITFDDGYADTYQAVEQLAGQNLPSTVYVTTGRLGARGSLSDSAIAELALVEHVQIGAHTVHHPHLDELTERQLREEVRGSKAVLEDLTRIRVTSFAYPHGSYDRRAREAVVLAGYESAAAVKNAMSHRKDDPYAIARWTVTAGTTACRIRGVLEGRACRSRGRGSGFVLVRIARRGECDGGPRAGWGAPL